MDALQPYLPWIVQGAAGAIGGNLAGVLRGARGLGPLANTVLGAGGGFAGAYALAASGYAEQAAALAADNRILADSIAAGMGGLMVPLLLSFFKRGS